MRSHNKLIDQLLTSVKEVEMLKYELWDLNKNHKKQTDDLLQTQTHLNQTQKQIWTLKAESAVKTTHLQALKNDT